MKFIGSLESALKTYIWAGRVTQVIDDLPTKCETLSSDPSTAKKNFK
jgi:hypothetical protein